MNLGFFGLNPKLATDFKLPIANRGKKYILPASVSPENRERIFKFY